MGGVGVDGVGGVVAVRRCRTHAGCGLVQQVVALARVRNTIGDQRVVAVGRRGVGVGPAAIL